MGDVGYVTHGTDRSLWAFRTPSLEERQIDIAKEWLDRIHAEVKELERPGEPLKDIKMVLTLREDMTIGWKEDQKWDDIMSLGGVILGEV